jgi:hypothetical protein
MASLVVLLLVICATMLASGATGIHIGLTHIHYDPNVTTSQFVHDALCRDMHRHNSWLLTASGNSRMMMVSAHTRKDLLNGGEYLMTLAIGTPPLSYLACASSTTSNNWIEMIEFDKINQVRRKQDTKHNLWWVSTSVE